MIHGLTILFLLLITLVFAGQAAADIYRWVDDNGQLHYSDSPPENVENVQKLEEGKHSVVTGVPAPKRTAAPVAETKPVAKKSNAEAPQVEIFTARW